MEQGGVLLWMWKVQFGVLLGFLVLWQSGGWICVCAEKPELRNLEKYESFFPPYIENWKAVFDEEKDDDEAGNVLVGRATGTESNAESIADRYGVIVRNRWKDTVEVTVHNMSKGGRTLYKMHPIRRGSDWSYRVKDYLADKGTKTVSFTLRRTEQNSKLSFRVERQLLWGAANTKYFGKNPPVKVAKLLIDAEKTEKKKKIDGDKGGEEIEGDADKRDDGDGVLALIYMVSGERLRKAFLYHLQWKNIMPKALQGDDGVYIKVKKKNYDVWIYNNSDEDPTLMSTGIPQFMPEKVSNSVGKKLNHRHLAPKREVEVDTSGELVDETKKKVKRGGTS